MEDELEDNDFMPEEETLMKEHQLDEEQYIEIAAAFEGYMRDYGTEATDAVYKYVRDNFEV